MKFMNWINTGKCFAHFLFYYLSSKNKIDEKKKWVFFTLSFPLTYAVNVHFHEKLNQIWRTGHQKINTTNIFTSFATNLLRRPDQSGLNWSILNFFYFFQINFVNRSIGRSDPLQSNRSINNRWMTNQSNHFAFEKLTPKPKCKTLKSFSFQKSAISRTISFKKKKVRKDTHSTNSIWYSGSNAKYRNISFKIKNKNKKQINKNIYRNFIQFSTKKICNFFSFKSKTKTKYYELMCWNDGYVRKKWDLLYVSRAYRP